MRKLAKLSAMATIAMLGAFIFAGSAGGDLSSVCRPVQVNLTGSIQLKWWYNESYIVSVQQNFTASVPPSITAGTYNATFAGVARIDEENIDFNGAIMTENGTFQAEFQVPVDGYTGPLGICGASGENLIVTISEFTVPPVTYAWQFVHVVGRVTGYGSSLAMGNLEAEARISNSTAAENSATAHVCWVPISGPLPHPDVLGNFTYSFYAARLINTTIVALNYSGYDFYIAGTWNVFNVTFSFSGISPEDFQETTTFVSQNATGELMVSGNATGPIPITPWGTTSSIDNFTLSIAGFENVTGSAILVTHARAFLEGDVLGHGCVDIYDLVYVARRIGATPGAPQWGGPANFEDIENADVNGDFHVDIYDLVTVATQMGQTG
jgi:hypothetical protein